MAPSVFQEKGVHIRLLIGRGRVRSTIGVETVVTDKFLLLRGYAPNFFMGKKTNTTASNTRY